MTNQARTQHTVVEWSKQGVSGLLFIKHGAISCMYLIISCLFFEPSLTGNSDAALHTLCAPISVSGDVALSCRAPVLVAAVRVRTQCAVRKTPIDVGFAATAHALSSPTDDRNISTGNLRQAHAHAHTHMAHTDDVSWHPRRHAFHPRCARTRLPQPATPSGTTLFSMQPRTR